MVYSHVVLGGTFDHLHAGHRDLLLHAFNLGRKVTLGLTKASMNRKKRLSSQIQSFAHRAESILQFAQSQGREQDIHILPIRDIYGSTLRDRSLECIIVTPHTAVGATHINETRIEQGLPALTVSVCPLRFDEHEKVLCSSNIRAGLVNREGAYYIDLFLEDRHLHESAREALRRPFGISAKKSVVHASRSPVVLIGDVVTDYALKHKIAFDVAYIDGLSRRKSFQIDPSIDVIQTDVKNPAGTISKETTSHLLESLRDHTLSRRRQIFQIHGEEDLLTVASVLLAPLGSLVIYGYPYFPTSMRMIRVTERIKNKFAQILKI